MPAIGVDTERTYDLERFATREVSRTDGDGRPEALLVTAPPPGDADHEPVGRGVRQNQFEPPTHS
jgi:hypothetical protein